MSLYASLRYAKNLGKSTWQRQQKRTSIQQIAQIAEFDLKNEILEINGQIKQ